MSREPRVAIIGAGISGIATAYTLRQAGFTDVVVLEKGSDVGGVWHWNRYPGLTCDVPSQLYQFSFAPKADWSRVWASGREIQRYHRDVCDRLGLSERIRLNTEVVSAEYADGTWTLTDQRGERIVVDFLICATGVLHNPAIPDLPGLGDFAGRLVHTARWDDEIVTDGRRVGVIGTGSTGVQVVSALAPGARSVTHFVRSPQWILWAPMRIPQPRIAGRVLRRAPRLHSRVYDAFLRASGILADIVTTPSWRRRAVQAYARLSLRLQVRDPRLREMLTPDYQPLCKRQVVSGSYYRALQRADTELVTDGIAQVTPTGVTTVDGRHHELDVLVLATGFRTHDYMRPMHVVGRDGLTLDQAWTSGPRAYRMTAIPGFPNLFTVLGPNSPTGSISLQHSAELTARYIAQWLERFRRGEVDTVEVTGAATERFQEQVAGAMGPTVWNTGCSSWYLTEGGAIDLWPFDRATMERMLAAPDESDFETRTRPFGQDATPPGFDRHTPG
ncbi:NAD(P)/FAD-dependent oxidoreductase [Tsukamurella sp. 8F]|uniref:flavin-containing monooxygenase n=1 Tax=unclassified Tsukamurella TaxID=2633480 RepID=UPI0023B9D9C3|nr:MULTISPECIES: NAD(P)/FAD-dependent oxidoreductase [unclassified Tsukamurella]MDF0529113.1 NAD(P)/FAD-dependent oxidoreductase [Tsukamurella sp. 8J]MDF0588137.1 NAD(P)/FAD-dependent oxidoreductase [Tsukamurella sp. 8F]